MGGKRDDWSAWILKLKGSAVLVVALYLQCNQGMGSYNTPRLLQVRCLIRQMAIPRIVLAGWKCEPAIVASSAWFRDVGGSLLVPQNVEFTCFNGKRLIDFVVHSP